MSYPFNWIQFAVSILGALIIGMIGSYLASFGGGIWYTEIQNGQGYLPIWLSEYIWIGFSLLAGVAFYRAWIRGLGHRDRRAAIGVFLGVQLALNPVWSGVSMGIEGPFLSTIKAIIMITAVLIIIHRFFRKDRSAGFLLIPYLIWMTIAAIPGLASLIN